MKKISKSSKYRLMFSMTEEDLFSFSEEVEEQNKIAEDFLGFHENMKGSLLYYFKRLLRLRELEKALMIIYHDVNNDTKEVIKQLYFNGSSFKETAEIINAKEKRVIIQHNYIVDEVLDILGFDITNKNKYKSRKDRYIPLNVKREVFERDGGKCQSCDSENNLHYHHIKRYSNGGVNKAYNLILLCSSCHANEHRGETAYNLLK